MFSDAQADSAAMFAWASRLRVVVKISFDSVRRACRILSRKEVTLMAKKRKAAKASKKKAKKAAKKK